MRRFVATVAVSFAVSGCFTYIPIEPGEVEPGVSVRARVSPSASARIAPLLGAAEARRLDGMMVSQSPDTLIVEVPTVIMDTREFGRSPNQRVSIPRSDLVELEVRRLDRLKTAGVVAAAGTILATTLIKMLQGEPGREPLPGGGGTEAIVFRISWP